MECKDTHREKSLGLSEKPHPYCMVKRNSIYCKTASWVLLAVLCGCGRSRREELASFPFLPTVINPPTSLCFHQNFLPHTHPSLGLCSICPSMYYGGFLAYQVFSCLKQKYQLFYLSRTILTAVKFYQLQEYKT